MPMITDSRGGAALIIGAGDGIGRSVAHAFAREGLTACVTRRARHQDQLAALVAEIEAVGGTARGFATDARDEDETVALFEQIEREVGPLEVVVFNIGANVRFDVTETTAQVYRKVWEMAAFAGFLAGREAARHMTARAARAGAAAAGAGGAALRVRPLAGEARQKARGAVAGAFRLALRARLHRLPDAPGARLAQRLWRAPAGAVLEPLVLRRHAVHHRRVAVGAAGLRDVVLAAAGEAGRGVDAARAGRDCGGAGLYRGERGDHMAHGAQPSRCANRQ
ncbi:SDR family NAD(P)-dependent oxidoreductase [Leptolyngbya sp. 15MV]|nr:SDR family NAD(P)-dependent oxidoreductase [Leptolyngbya sp. 15MV]